MTMISIPLPLVFVAATVALFLLFVAAVFGWDKGWREMKEIERARSADYCGQIRRLDVRIRDLEAQLKESESMARKPLTEEQLAACKAAHGLECPRCGNDADDIEFSDLGAGDDDPSLAFQDATCNSCNETWQIRYRLESVVATEE